MITSTPAKKPEPVKKQEPTAVEKPQGQQPQETTEPTETTETPVSEELEKEKPEEANSDYWKAKSEEYKADIVKMLPTLEQHVTDQHWMEVAQTANTIAQFAREIWKIGG